MIMVIVILIFGVLVGSFAAVIGGYGYPRSTKKEMFLVFLAVGGFVFALTAMTYCQQNRDVKENGCLHGARYSGWLEWECK